MAAIVGIVSRCGLRIESRCRNQPNKSKLSLYKPLLCLYSHLKQPYISNKMKHFSYKGGCGVHGRTRIEMFKRRAGLGYGFRLLVIKCNYTTKKLKKKAVINLKQYCMCYYVTLSIVFYLNNTYGTKNLLRTC